MGSDLREKGEKAAQIKVQKREAALRENLKRRKLAAVGNRPDDKQKGNDGDEQSENCE